MVKNALGSLAQLGEHLPYKQRVTGSSPVTPTIFTDFGAFYGPVVQLVRTLACHARGRGFEPHPGRQFLLYIYADLAHLVERHLAKVEVASSSLVIRSIRPRNSGGKKVFAFVRYACDLTKVKTFGAIAKW